MLSEVPEGWCKARIDAVLQRNTTSVSVTELAAEGLVAHYSLPAFDANKKPVIESGSEIKSNKTAIDKDCLLFSKLNPRIPRVWRVRHSGEQKPVCSTEFWALKPKTGEVSLSYAEYFLGWNGFLSHPTIKPASSTNSHQRVDRKAFDAFLLPLPPLNEQHRIAEILSSVDASIQATQAVIEQAERVKRGLMEELLTGGLGSDAIERGEVPEGWEVKTLQEISVMERGKFSARPRNDPKYYGGEYPFIQTGDVANASKFVRSYSQTLNEEGLRVSRLFPAGTLMMSIAANVGNVALVTFETAAPDSVISITPNEDNAEEVFYYLLSSVKGRLEAIATQNAQANLNLDKLNKFKVLMPPKSLWTGIASALAEFDACITSQQNVVEQQIRTKRGLMDDLLTGKVRTV